MTKEEFYKKLKEIKIELNPLQKEQFENYYKFLNEYNNHTNITAITNKEDVYLKHFYDSALLATTIDFNKITNLLDIGCGAGFPGMVIAIARSDIEVTLIEPTGKRCTFLEEVKNTLALSNVTIVNKRAEECITIYREMFDAVTARAVANLQVLSELCIPFVKINGVFISMKGSQGEEETALAKHALAELGSSAPIVEKEDLPDGAKRVFVICKKAKKTPMKYPRAYAKIKKKPL